MVDRLQEAEREITRYQQERERWIDYTTDLQRIIEALCNRRELPEPVSTARHHYNMAKFHLEAQTLSRTGAVKVKVAGILYAIKALDDAGFDDGEFVFDSRKELAEMLSALEPAAPEGQQPVAYRVHAPADEHYGIGPDRLQFHPLAQYDLDNGYRQTPLYTRPAEQAVTEAMVDRFIGVYETECRHRYDRNAIRAALKAAMEAGRHD